MGAYRIPGSAEKGGYSPHTRTVSYIGSYTRDPVITFAERRFLHLTNYTKQNPCSNHEVHVRWLFEHGSRNDIFTKIVSELDQEIP